MQRARGQVKRTRVYAHLCTLACRDRCNLGEADVVADAEADAREVCVEVVRRRASCKGLAFLKEAIVSQGDVYGDNCTCLKCDLPRDIDVEKVDLAVDGDELACGTQWVRPN